MTTGRELCRAARERLEMAGVEAAGRDVSLLFLHALNFCGAGIERHHLANHLDREISPDVQAAFARAIDARADRQPVSQITGRRSFWRHEFIVTGDTLDPRPETELLVEEALKLPWRNVLDLGTGTGAILISLLAARPGAAGMGTDISEAALEVARRNAHLIGVTTQLVESDWYEGVMGRFNLIISNPPYIALPEMSGLAPEVREWEPHQALTDGGDGLSAYREIANGAGDHLASGGYVMVEIGAAQGEAVTEIFREYSEDVRLIPDLDGRDRVVSARFCD